MAYKKCSKRFLRNIASLKGIIIFQNAESKHLQNFCQQDPHNTSTADTNDTESV